MVTRRKPDAVISRPKKPEPSKLSKGRPSKLLVKDPERYLRALVQAFMDHQRATGIAGATDHKSPRAWLHCAMAVSLRAKKKSPGAWLQFAMARRLRAKEICFQGATSRRLYAEQLAEAIGEGEYFRDKMLPVLTAHDALRQAGFQGTDLPVSRLFQLSLPTSLPLQAS